MPPLVIAPVLVLEVPLEPLPEFEVGTEEVPVSASWLILETKVWDCGSGLWVPSGRHRVDEIKCAVLQHGPLDTWQLSRSAYRVAQERPA